MALIKFALYSGMLLVITFVVLFAGYGLREGHDVVSGLTHLFEADPAPAENNPVLADVAWQRVNWLGDIENRLLSESSGLAASNLHEGVLWSLNDSGNAPSVYAMDTNGRDLGAWRINVDKAVDWEAMDAFVMHDVSYLALGDTGDNFRWRRTLRVLIVEEPTDLAHLDTTLPVAWEVFYRYPEGYRDSEALAVDAAQGWIYVLSKRRYPPELFRVPLQPDDSETVEAELVAELNHLPRPTPLEYAEDDNARFRYAPSGMDLAGDRLLITTYRHAFLYTLSDLAKAPLRIKLPSVGQREALSFAQGRDDLAFVSRERSGGIADLFQIEFKLSDESSSEAVYVPTSGLSSAQMPGVEMPSDE